MRKRVWRALVVLGGLTVLAVVFIAFWPWLRPWFPHPNLIQAWIYYLTIDLDISRWGPAVTLLLIGALELAWALLLARRSTAPQRHLKRVERLHVREAELLVKEVALLQDERRALESDLALREGLIRDEEARLWAQLGDLDTAGLLRDRLVKLGAPQLSSQVQANWYQIISRLERIEMVRSVGTWQNESAAEVERHGQQLLRLGNACFFLGDYEQALSHYDRATLVFPEDTDLLIDRAITNEALGRHEAALLDLERVLAIGDHAWAFLCRGLVRERLGEGKRALEDYTRAIRTDPGLAEAYYRRGLLYARGEEYRKACHDQSQVLQLNQQDARAYMARGQARAALGDLQPALMDLDQACILNPHRFEAFYERGLVRHLLQNYGEALEDYTRAIALEPTFAPAFLAQGDTYLARGEVEQAIAAYSQAIEHQPRNATMYYARGVALVAAGENRQAIADYDRALEFDPDLTSALADRGAAYVRLGDYQRAIDDLDRAISLDPTMAVAYYHRGLAHGTGGNYAKASRDLDLAIELDPSFRERVQRDAGAA
jgi:tetratricopeptide (TPR) repeat protein